MKAAGIYESDDLRIKFVGDYTPYEEGDEVENIGVAKLEILGVEVDFEGAPEALQAAILELGNDGFVEFEPEDTSEQDDIGEDE